MAHEQCKYEDGYSYGFRVSSTVVFHMLGDPNMTKEDVREILEEYVLNDPALTGPGK